MKLQQMIYFTETVNSKSFSVAAKNLYISQPSLSSAIMLLEEELGVQLLIREHKCVIPTEAGKVFYSQCTLIINEINQLKNMMVDYSTLKKGNINIGVLWIAGYVGILECIEEYLDSYANISGTIYTAGSIDLVNKVINHELDCAFVIANKNTFEKYPNLYHKKIIDDEYICLIPDKNPLANKDVIDIKDFNNQKLIMPGKDSHLRVFLDEEFKKNDVKATIVAEASQSDIVIQMASSNLAIGFSSCSVVSHFNNHLLQKSIVPTMHREIYFIYLKQLENYPTIKHFSNYINEFYKSNVI